MKNIIQKNDSWWRSPATFSFFGIFLKFRVRISPARVLGGHIRCPALLQITASDAAHSACIRPRHPSGTNGFEDRSEIRSTNIMQSNALLMLVATLALSATVTSSAEDNADTPLSKEMSELNKSLRLLKRQVADPAKKAENLQLVAKIRKNSKASQKYEPAQAKDVPLADKAAYLKKYKNRMVELDKSFEQLETALKDNKQAEARQLFEKLADQKEQGHKEFFPEGE